MRIAEQTPTRLAIEDSGSGWGLVCVLAGHAIAGLAIAKPAWHLWLEAAEIAAGAALALSGAVALTRTRIVFDRRMGEIHYERRNIFHARAFDAYFYEVEDVLLQRGPRAVDPFRADPTQSYSFRPAIRLRGRDWPLARAYRDHGAAALIAQAIRAALADFAFRRDD